MTTALFHRSALMELAETTARALSAVGTLDGRAFIRTPVLFPSGATAVVVLEYDGRDSLSLTDLGQGNEEADLMGVGTSYLRHARQMAPRTGLSVQGSALVLNHVRADQAPAAVMTIANAAGRALEHALMRGDQRTDPADRDRLRARLATVFPEARLSLHAELRGGSNHSWPFDAVMETERGRVAFELVRPHPVSVAFTSTKFHDLARLDRPPGRIAMVHRKADLGDLLGVIGQAACVIEDDAADSVLREAALAA